MAFGVSLFLASASPRRRELLQALAWPVVVRPVPVAEDRAPGETGPAMVARLAARKAYALCAALPPRRKQDRKRKTLVVGADTTVDVEGRILGKPQNAETALAYLSLLRATPHSVHSGLCVIDAHTGQRRALVHSARLTLRALAAHEMQAYARSGRGWDKAGGYGLQDTEYRLVDRLEGCAAGAMGLPLGAFVDLCRQEFACPPPRDFAAACRQATGHPCCRS